MVGIKVGVRVGTGVGSKVGNEVGSSVGTSVGTNVGTNVGKGVGSFVEDEKTVVSRHDNVARVTKKEGLRLARNIFLCGRFRPCNANVGYLLRPTACIF